MLAPEPLKEPDFNQPDLRRDMNTEQINIPPFPREIDYSLGDGKTTCLNHRQWEWTIAYYYPTMPDCTICGGKCDPRQTAHCLCEARQKRNLPILRLDYKPECSCAKCGAERRPTRF
jgi:hypothetical protein